MDEATVKAMQAGFGALTTIAAWVGAVGVIWNIFKTVSGEKPFAHLNEPEPSKDGLVNTGITITNPGRKSVRVDDLSLCCGTFAGEMLQDNCGGVIGYARAGGTKMPIGILVAPKESRNVNVTFHVNDGVSVVGCRMVRKGTGHVIIIEEHA